MSYDVHVVRTPHWIDASENPITQYDVNNLIASDQGLDWSTTDYIDIDDDKGGMTRYYFITWKKKSCFWWYRDQIICSNPDRSQLIKLAWIARLLDAYLIGDDNEQYKLTKNFFGKVNIMKVEPEL